MKSYNSVTQNSASQLSTANAETPKESGALTNYLIFLGLAGAAIVGTTLATRKVKGPQRKVLNRVLGLVVPLIFKRFEKKAKFKMLNSLKRKNSEHLAKLEMH